MFIVELFVVLSELRKREREWREALKALEEKKSQKKKEIKLKQQQQQQPL